MVQVSGQLLEHDLLSGEDLARLLVIDFAQHRFGEEALLGIQ